MVLAATMERASSSTSLLLMVRAAEPASEALVKVSGADAPLPPAIIEVAVPPSVLK